MQSNNADKIRELNELYEDALFGLAINEAAEKEGKILINENEQLGSDQEIMPSQKEIDRFVRLVDLHWKTAKKDRRNHRTSRIHVRAAVAMLVLFFMLSAMMLTVRAFRIRVLNFLIGIEPKFTSFQLKDGDEEQNSGQLLVSWTNTYVPTYIPEGYEASGISYSDTVKKVKYISQEDDSSIVFSEYDSKSSIAVDTENASLVETVKINDHVGTLSVKDFTTSLVWVIDNHIFSIQGQMSAEEAVRMAEGVKFIK